MTLPDARFRRGATITALVFAASISLIPTVYAETWELEVAGAKVTSDGNINIQFSDAGADMMDGLMRRPKKPIKELRVGGIVIALGQYNQRRKELRVSIQGLIWRSAFC